MRKKSRKKSVYRARLADERCCYAWHIEVTWWGGLAATLALRSFGLLALRRSQVSAW